MFTIQASTCIIDNLFSNKSIIVAFVCEIIKKIVRQKMMKTCRFMDIFSFYLIYFSSFVPSLSFSLLHIALSSTKDDGARARERELRANNGDCETS